METCTAFKIFCDCFLPDDIRASSKHAFAWTAPGRLILPPSFRRYETEKKSSTYWSSLKTGNGNVNYQDHLDKAASDPRQTYIFCFDELQRLADAMLANERYVAYFNKNRRLWSKLTQDWFDKDHAAYPDAGLAPINSLGGYVNPAGRKARETYLSKGRDIDQTARTYPEMLMALYYPAHKMSARMEAIYDRLLFHLTQWHGESKQEPTLQRQFFSSGEEAAALGAFLEKVRSLQADISVFERANMQADGERLSLYCMYSANLLARYLADQQLVESFLACFERVLPEFVMQLHKDWATSEHAADEVTDLFALKTYLRLAREDDGFDISHLLYHVVKALSQGAVDLTDSVSALFLTSAAAAGEAGEAKAEPVNHAAYALHVVESPAAAGATFKPSKRVGRYICGRSWDPDEDQPARDICPAWRFVRAPFNDISRNQFTLEYDATRDDWKLTAHRGMYCRPYDAGANAQPALLVPGMSAYLGEIAWFALPYRVAETNERRYVQVFTECLTALA